MAYAETAQANINQVINRAREVAAAVCSCSNSGRATKERMNAIVEKAFADLDTAKDPATDDIRLSHLASEYSVILVQIDYQRKARPRPRYTPN